MELKGSLKVMRRNTWPWITTTQNQCPPPGDLPDRGIEPRSPALQVDSLPFKPLTCPLVKVSRSFTSNSLWPHGQYSPWNSLSQNTGVGSHSLLKGIFWSQGSNPGLLHCRWISYQLSHKGSPVALLNWWWAPSTQAMIFSSRSCLRHAKKKSVISWKKISLGDKKEMLEVGWPEFKSHLSDSLSF